VGRRFAAPPRMAMIPRLGRLVLGAVAARIARALLFPAPLERERLLKHRETAVRAGSVPGLPR